MIFLKEEHELLRRNVREFAERYIEPVAKDIDETERYPEEIIRKLAELDLMGIPFPKEYGGAGGDFLSFAIAIEELARADGGIAAIVAIHCGISCSVIYNFGTEEQKKKYLTPLAKGEKMGAFALTEPGAGSDPGSAVTEAVLDGDEYVINGTKCFITNGPQAEVVTVFALTDKSKGTRGMSAFIVPKEAGFKVGKKESKMGIRASQTSELIFKDVRVPKENMLGKEGDGFRIAMATLDGGRVGVAAQSVGLAQAALDESIKYSKQRVQFGRPISSNQAIQWMIADMATDIHAARLMTYYAAMLKDQGKPFSKEASMAKLFASDVAVRAARSAVQIHGGYGYMKGYKVERLMRDAKITEIYEGTSEIQRIVIANNLLR